MAGKRQRQNNHGQEDDSFRNGYWLKVPPLVWRETWWRNLENIPKVVLDFVCKERLSSGDVCHFQEDPDFLEADFSLVMNPEFENKSGSMHFDILSVGESGAILLATDLTLIEFTLSVRGKDVCCISDDFIAMSEEKDHVQYIFYFSSKHIENQVLPKFGGTWKYSSQLKRPLYMTEVAYCINLNLCHDYV
jgi:hypothetical protein